MDKIENAARISFEKDGRRMILFWGLSISCNFVDAIDGIEASGVTDIRQALGNHLQQKSFVVAQVQISLDVAHKLRFTTALRSQKAKSNHFPLL